MRTLFFLSFFGLCLVAFPSCGDDETSLVINFKLRYGDEPLTMFENLEYPDGKQFNLSRFSFYLSELQIGNQLIDEARYIDLTASHSTSEKAERGGLFTFQGLSDEQINNVQFSIGLNSTVNATIPGDYSSNDDLSLSSEYWTPWSSYIFSKTEGRLDTDNDQMNETAFALHLGLDDAYRNVSLDTDFMLTGETTLTIFIDLQKMFDTNGSFYDLEATPQIHQTNSINEINQLCDNLVGAFSVE